MKEFPKDINLQIIFTETKRRLAQTKIIATINRYMTAYKKMLAMTQSGQSSILAGLIERNQK
jgi:hypothetical protein